MSTLAETILAGVEAGRNISTATWKQTRRNARPSWPGTCAGGPLESGANGTSSVPRRHAGCLNKVPIRSKAGFIISSGTQSHKTRQQLYENLERLEKELQEREAVLPAHSVRPHQLLEIEELEERIKRLKDEIKTKEQAE